MMTCCRDAATKLPRRVSTGMLAGSPLLATLPTALGLLDSNIHWMDWPTPWRAFSREQSFQSRPCHCGWLESAKFLIAFACLCSTVAADAYPPGGRKK